MAGTPISALPAVPSSLATDIVPIDQLGVTSRATLAQISSLFDTTLTAFVPLAGGTMTGSLILNGSPTLPNMAANKAYVDLVGAGFTVILSALAATTANLNTTYANGASGVGATLTDAAGTFAAFAVDGTTPALNSRILVKNQTTTFQNGVYALTTNGDGISIPYVLTRTTDYDQPSEIKPGTLIAVNTGTSNATTSWLETATVVTVGSDPILFSQFTFGPSSFLLRANNLSDVSSAATSLVNLGLGVPTGTGNVVRQTSPTLITPTIGVASATAIKFASSTGILDSNGLNQLLFVSVPLAVNYLAIINNATGSSPALFALGSDSNITLQLNGKGTGGVAIYGTSTNDNAANGAVGEYVSSVVLSASGVSIPTNTSTNMTSINLDAGDWNIEGNITFLAAAGAPITGSYCWISTTSAILPDNSHYTGWDCVTGSTQRGLNTPFVRLSLAAPTTVYISGLTVFGSSTVKMSGGIYARRVR